MPANQSFSTPLPAPAPALNAAQAEQLAAHFIAVMDELTGVVERETELVRLGRLAKATELAPQKDGLTRQYNADALTLRANQGNLARVMPAKLDALRKRHQAFRARLQINLTVLATAHAISEGIVRGVSGEMARKSTPQTYGASGRPNEPGRNVTTPLAVSRVL
jgi:hypothetical protein